jgi:hypothetical protein
MITTQQVSITPDMQSDGTPPGLEFYDGDIHSCEWTHSACTETAEYYVQQFCGDPDCRARHMSYYCKRHYVITIGLILDHLHVCEEMSKATTADQVQQVALNHVAAFGAISGNPDQ